MRVRYLPCVLGVLLCLALNIAFSAADAEITLSDEDNKYLDGLMSEFLFDPKGAERVAVKTIVRSSWRTVDETLPEGWLVAGKDGKAGRVFFMDGESIPAPPEADRKKIDFLAACRARYTEEQRKADEAEEGAAKKGLFAMRSGVGFTKQDENLANAAWLYRLGENRLAAEVLALARKRNEDPRKRLRDALAWSANFKMLTAYIVCADAEAVAHGERLLRLYPDAIKVTGKAGDHGYPQAARIVAELRRRNTKGKFGIKPPKKLPEDFEKWDLKKRTEFALGALEDINAQQQDWAADNRALQHDRRVKALASLGEASIPTLLEALDSDDRLTRSAYSWGDDMNHHIIMGVNDAIYAAAMMILRTEYFDPVSTEYDNLYHSGQLDDKLVNQMRAYWAKYGKMPFDERMMNLLADPQIHFEAKKEAVKNLVSPPIDYSPEAQRQGVAARDEAKLYTKAMRAKFMNPTVAEAILAAMDAELKWNIDEDRKNADTGLGEGDLDHIEKDYREALIELGDVRIARILTKRAAEAKAAVRRCRWAFVAHELGEPQPMRSIAEEFRAGKMQFEANYRFHDEYEFELMIQLFIKANTLECDRALAALGNPQHPQHEAYVAEVLGDAFSDDSWFAHPVCLPILRKALDDRSLTGAEHKIEGDRLKRTAKISGSSRWVHDYLADPSVRYENRRERFCDFAAERISENVAGMPFYHTLLKDTPQRLESIKAILDRFGDHYRRASGHEVDVLAGRGRDCLLIPDIGPLDHAATEKDVKTGKAIFHFPGAKPANLKLPMVAVLNSEEKTKWPRHGLIVQAEEGVDGKVRYGIIAEHELLELHAIEVRGIQSIEQFIKKNDEALQASMKELRLAREKEEDTQ